MGAEIKPSLFMMKYHPLPHEFGLRTNVIPASFSAGWVSGWEIGNAVRMKEKALRQGDIPVTSYVRVKFAFVNGKLVAVGGESQVSFVAREKIYKPLLKTDPELDAPKHKNFFNQGSLGALQDLRMSEIEFFQVLFQVTDQESRDELMRFYFLYASGLISEREFARKIRNIKEKDLTGNIISEFV